MKVRDSDSGKNAERDTANRSDRAARVAAVARFRRRRSKMKRLKMTIDEIVADRREGHRH